MLALFSELCSSSFELRKSRQLQIKQSFSLYLLYNKITLILFTEKIKEFLTEQLNEDAEMASALLIHTVNKDTEKVGCFYHYIVLVVNLLL